MGLYWYNIPSFAGKTLEENRASLAPLGVMERQEIGQVHYSVDPDTGHVMKSIGDIIMRTATGLIEVWPYVGATYGDLVPVRLG